MALSGVESLRVTCCYFSGELNILQREQFDLRQSPWVRLRTLDHMECSEVVKRGGGRQRAGVCQCWFPGIGHLGRRTAEKNLRARLGVLNSKAGLWLGSGRWYELRADEEATALCQAAG